MQCGTLKCILKQKKYIHGKTDETFFYFLNTKYLRTYICIYTNMANIRDRRIYIFFWRVGKQITEHMG